MIELILAAAISGAVLIEETKVFVPNTTTIESVRRTNEQPVLLMSSCEKLLQRKAEETTAPEDHVFLEPQSLVILRQSNTGQYVADVSRCYHFPSLEFGVLPLETGE